jgi:C4-dicarboxylate-specific signal transduction histidine kinase
MGNMDFDDIKTAVQTIKRRSEGLIRFVSDFQSLTHMPEPKLEHITVQEMFSEIKMLLHKDLETENVVFSTHLSPESMVITADREQIEQVLINLIKNAKEALEEFDETDKQYKSISLIGNTDAKNRPVITVKDNGPGIEKTALDRIFIPFFTTKKKGSGIGLSLSRQILRQHKGTLIAKSEEGKGTEFSLKF